MAQQGPQQRNPYYQWYQQNRALVWGTAAAAAALYGAYTYSSEGKDNASSSQQRQRPQSQYQKLRSMLTNYSNAASTLAETASLVSTDLRSFLTSDSSEVPQSLRQLNKLLQSAEIQETVTTVTSSVVKGVSRALPAGLGSAAGSEGPPLVDTIIEAVLSERGRGLVGMAVGVATRNATQAVCEFMERRMEAAASAASANGSVGIKEVLDVLTSEHGEKLLTLLLTKSIRTAVTSYVDATTGYNLYDDMLASIAKQEHRDALTDVLSRLTASFCKEVVISYRRATAAAAAQGAGGTGTSGMPGNAPAGKHHQQHQHQHAQQHPTPGANVANGTVMPVMVKGGALGSGCSLDAVLAAAASGGSELALTASTRCNGSLGAAGQQQSGVNGRTAQASSAGSQQQQGLVSRQHSVNGGVNAALSRAMLAQAPPVWLKQVVELVGQRDVRSLTVEVVKNASREATRGAVEGLLQGAAQSGARLEGGGSVLVLPACAAGYKLYVLATLAVSLAMYALSPRLVML